MDPRSTRARVLRLSAMGLACLAPCPTVAQDAVVAPLFAVHRDGHLLTGAAAGIPLGPMSPFALAISGGFDGSNDFIEPSKWEYWEVNFDLVLYGGSPALGGLFLFSGLNLATVYEEDTGFFPPGPRAEETLLAANLGGGLAFVLGSVMPLLGAKLEIGRRTPFLVFLAFGIPLGRD